MGWDGRQGQEAQETEDMYIHGMRTVAFMTGDVVRDMCPWELITPPLALVIAGGADIRSQSRCHQGWTPHLSKTRCRK